MTTSLTAFCANATDRRHAASGHVVIFCAMTDGCECINDIFDVMGRITHSMRIR